MNQLRIAIATALAALTSCGALGRGPVEVEHPRETTASGVTWRDLERGTGPSARAGDRLTVDYVIELGDGTLVDSTRDRGQPESFVLGAAPIAGWNEALLGLEVGGRRRVEVPPPLAFGDEGLPGRVPPGAALICTIELLALEPGS